MVVIVVELPLLVVNVLVVVVELLELLELDFGACNSMYADAPATITIITTMIAITATLDIPCFVLHLSANNLSAASPLRSVI